MGSIINKTCAVAAVLALQAGAVMAAGDNAGSAAEIPKSGQVSREGTVERIVDNDTIIFRDQLSNKTVDVHTSAAVQTRVGDRVRVDGTAQSEALGMGHEIVNASVTPVSATNTGGMGGPYEPLNNGRATGNTGTNTTTGTGTNSGATY